MRARTLIAGLFLLTLFGCGGNDHRPTEPIPANFTTEILADGTKLFTFALRPEGRPEGGPPALRRQRGGPGPEGQPPRRGASPAASHRLLAALLEENRYCREGYLTLQQYGLYGGYTIRGECRDGADAQDRSRFPNARADSAPAPAPGI